jgi:hypothetical protein
MGAGSPVLAYDVTFNREVLGEAGRYFADAGSLTRLIERAENDPTATRADGEALQIRAASRYRWEDVADGYEAMCHRLVTNQHRRRLGHPELDRPAVQLQPTPDSGGSSEGTSTTVGPTVIDVRDAATPPQRTRGQILDAIAK